jgi:predicted NACHT family NTPase
MVISELALGLFTNLLYDSFKNIPEYISDTSSKVYEKAIEEFSNKNYKLTGIQIDTFFRQKNVENAIEKYLKNPDKLDCSEILIHEFFELFSEEDFSHEDADLILNSFFEILDAEVEKYPELIIYLDHYLAKRTDKTVQEIYKVISGSRENQDKKESGVNFEESLEKYLNKIIDDNENKEINEIYTELSAKEILPVTLKFRETESDIPREYEVLELVEKEEKLIISGESGSGKTTTLRWLNYILAKSYLERKSENIPLYIELNSYIGEERFIKNPFDIYVARKAEGKGISEDILKTILKGKAIILLDGFDLLSPTDEFYPYDKISNFINDYNNCRFVISSRPSFFESIKNNFKVSELEKLTDEKIEIFINRYVSNEELADNLKDEILSNEQLKPILSNPMMLYIAIKVAIGRKDKSDDLLPSNRSELYEAFISTLFNHQNDKGKRLHANRIQIENALTDLYFNLQCKNEVSCKYSEALKFVKKSSEDPLFRKISPQLILEDCFILGILNRNDNYVSYGIHQSFQEFFAAIKLKELFESGYDISEAFSHPKWEEVVRFTSEMLDSDLRDKFIDSMLLNGELFLASKCVNEASGKTKEKLCALLADKLDSKFTLEKIYSIQSLGNIGNIGVNLLIETLADEDTEVRREAVKSLGKIEFEKIFELLAMSFKDEDPGVRGEVASLLGRIKDERAVELLINSFSFECSYVQVVILKALIETNYEKKIELLIKAIENKDSDLSDAIIYILGEIKSEKAEKSLKNMLNDDNSEIREEAAKTLIKIKSEIVDEKLITGLEDQNLKAQKKSVNSLKENKSQEELQSLAELLCDENVRLSRKDLIALDKITSKDANELLEPSIKALKNKIVDKRFMAVRILGKIKSKKTIEPLIEALNDETYLVRQLAANSLRCTKSEKAVSPLINTLNDENHFVRGAAAEALRNCCTLQNKEQLDKLLKSDNIFVRNTVFEILYKIEKEEKSKLILFKELKKRSEIITKYSIFVSSVQKELENERVTIQDFVENDSFLSAHYTSLLYEYEPAYPEKTLDGCLNALNSCQVYLLIVGVKYGSLLGEISITHTEYRYAKEKKLPILVFIKGERNIEREPGTETLLREIDSDDFKYKRFRNVIELKKEVSESLKKLLQDEGKFLKT